MSKSEHDGQSSTGIENEHLCITIDAVQQSLGQYGVLVGFFWDMVRQEMPDLLKSSIIMSDATNSSKVTREECGLM